MVFQAWNHEKKEKGKQFYCQLILLMSATLRTSQFLRYKIFAESVNIPIDN